MQIVAKDSTKKWVEYTFNPISLASTAIAKESLFCNAIANVQCERNLKVDLTSSGRNMPKVPSEHY